MKRILLAILFVALTATPSFAAFGGDLKANTAVDVKIGPFVDVGDGFTPQTDIGDPDIANDLDGTDESYLIKHGAADNGAIQLNSGGQDLTWDQIDNMDGYYNLSLGTAETNTEGMLTIIIQDDSECLPVSMHYMVLSEAAYNSKYGADDDGTGYMRVDGYEVNDTGQTANDNSADINDILTDTSSTLDTLIKDIPTNAEFALRTILAADYVVVGDTIAGVTLVTTTTTNTDMRGTDGVSLVIPDAAGTAATPAEVATALTNYDGPTDTEMLAAHTTTDALVTSLHSTTDALVNGIDDNVWDDVTRSLTIIDEDSTTIDLDGSYVGGVTIFDEDSTIIDIDGTTIGTVTTCTTTTTNTDLVTAAAIKTSMEAEGTSDLDAIADAIANGTYGLSAIRTQGDAAWVTATGFSTLTASDNIGINWADVSNKTSTVALTGTTISESSNPSAATIATAVWAAIIRTLTALDEDDTTIDIDGTTIGTTTTNTDMRGTNNAALAATALSSSTWTNTRAGYLDELSAGNLPADIDSILSDTRTSGVQIDLSQTIEDAYILAHYYRLSSAILFGLADGGGTTTITYKQLDGTNTRLVYTVDEVGDRSDVVRTLTE